MRNIFLLIAFGFIFYFSVTAQSGYSYVPKGTRFLVGKERPYFGSQKVPDETGPYFKKINPDEPTQNLGEIFPQIGLNGRGLFLNFSPNGIAHICELEGTTKVVRSQDGKVYAVVCGNLLVFLEAFEGEKIPEKVSKREKNYNKVDEGPQNYNQNERRIIGVMPPTEFMVYICFWQKYESPSLLRYVTQQEAQVAISSSGRCSGWRICTDADLAHFGVHKPAYQNEIVRSGYR